MEIWHLWHLWHLWIIAGVVFLIFEMFAPTLFMASLGLGCFASAAIACIGGEIFVQGAVFAVVSIVLIILIRPYVKKSINNKPHLDTGMSQYIGKTAKVLNKINNAEDTGRIRIFDEEWVARSFNNDVIEVNEIVIIKKIEGLIIFVEKTGGEK